MFEFHGWAHIRVEHQDDPDLSVIASREEDVIERLHKAIQEVDDNHSIFDLKRTSNRMIVLYVHGLRNHRYKPVIDLFQRIATESPWSYGLLYVQDDEDHNRGADYENEFRVWRLARGRFEEMADPFLSPYIPTVELPWDGK